MPDGREVSPIDWPSHWWGYTRDVGIKTVASLYKNIEPHECLVLGGVRGRDRVIRAKRTEFHLPPTDLLVLDIDGMPYVGGCSDDTLKEDPRGTIRTQLSSIFASLIDRGHFVVALSSRAGFTGDFRAHVWVGLGAKYDPRDVRKLLRSTGKDWLDDSIFHAGRVLFAAAPEIDDDPFPTRVFEFEGDCVLDISESVRSTEGLVELTKPVTRGKSALYRMSEDRLLASEFVSEECFNFVLSAKRAGLSEDDTIEALRAEFERLEVPQATWNRMRAK
ncbi:MAG: hypothetical protein AAF368_10075, partial [Planctomycetota bacterium]